MSDPKKIIRWENGVTHEATDELAEEAPLEIRVRGRAISVTMRTPGHDDELAAGFLLTEQIIRSRDDVLKIAPCVKNEFGNTIDVILAPTVAVDFEKLTRHVFASSSCGVCGKATIESILHATPSLQNSLKVDVNVLSRLPVAAREHQKTFDRTGGIHAASLFDASGNLIVLREDVGRHNAVDKVIGYALLNNLLPLDHHVLLVSSRASFEIMQKALAAKIAIIAAVSAPSSLAVQFAEDSNQTLIGFLRDARMNIYTHADRIALS